MNALLLIVFIIPVIATPLANQAVHKVSIHDHPKDMVSSMLYNTYSEVFDLGKTPKALAKLNSQSIFLQLSRKLECLEQSLVRFFLKTVTLTQRNYQASECRINTSDRHFSVLRPTFNPLAILHGSLESGHDELKHKTQLYIESLPIAQIGFYNYSALDYDFECLARQHELMQILYRETFLEAKLKKVVNVPEKCSFANVNPAFGTEYISEVTVEIPVNGTFECKLGTSPTCRKSIATSRNSRYKHFD